MCRTVYGRATLENDGERFIAEILQDAGCEYPALSRQEAILGASIAERHRLAVKAIKSLLEAINGEEAKCLRDKYDARNDLYGLLLAVEARWRMGLEI